MEGLYNKLNSYGKSNYYPFHMPGHKRNIEMMPEWNVFGMDITEIDGFDNLHNPKDILKHSMEKAVSLYKTKASYFLINGSTVGILSAIAAVSAKGQKILLARNSHKSVFHAVFLNELEAAYIYPEINNEFRINGGLLTEDIEEMLITHPEIKAVVVTSPTYEGVVSDIEGIAKLVHKYEIPLIVDEAHGAHFGFEAGFPDTAINKGADIVIQSLHKTLPALTQTSLLHLQGNLVNKEKLEKYLSIYQTSSPSYILLASIDYCINLMESDGVRLLKNYSVKLTTLRNKLKQLKHIKLLDRKQDEQTSFFDLDPSKLLLSVKGTDITGKELYDLLRDKYQLQMEMKMGDYVLAMTSLMDQEEGYHRLWSALKELDDIIRFKENKILKSDLKTIKPKIVKSIYEADCMKKERVPLERTVGKVVAEFIYLYPPGIPFIVPGEIMSEELLDLLKYYKRVGLEIEGFSDESGKTILILE